MVGRASKRERRRHLRCLQLLGFCCARPGPASGLSPASPLSGGGCDASVGQGTPWKEKTAQPSKMATFPPHELTCAPRVPATSSPVTAERAMGLSAGTRSLSCPLSRDSRSVDVTTESYSPQSRSPSSVLFSLVSTRLQRFVMKGFIFSPWPTLNHLPPSFPVALKNYFILFYFFHKGALLPPIQPQNKYGFGIRSLPPLRQRLPSHTSRCHFLHVFPLLVPLYFSALPLCGNEGGQDFFHQALLI